MQNTLSRALWAAVVFCAGCTSYQETALHQIEAHPDQLIDKKVRARTFGKEKPMNSIARIALLAIVVSFSVGCGSWKNIPLSEIESHPESVTDKKVRVKVSTPVRPLPRSGRSQREHLGTDTVSDSTIVLRVSSVTYPVLHGVTIPKARLSESNARPDTVAIDLTHALGTDVRVVGVMSTLGLVTAAYLVAWLFFHDVFWSSD